MNCEFSVRLSIQSIEIMTKSCIASYGIIILHGGMIVLSGGVVGNLVWKVST